MADNSNDPKFKRRANDREIRQEHESELNSPEYQKSSAGLAAPATEGQGAGSVGTIGAEGAANEYGAQKAGFAQGASGAQGETAASEQTEQHEPGTDQQKGFVATEDEDSGEYVQQAGFAEQGQGALEETESGDIERGGERTANRDTDIEGSSENP